VDVYCKSLEGVGVTPYIVRHLSGAMEDYQRGAMSGADNNIEKLTGKKPMSVGDFARAPFGSIESPKEQYGKDWNLI
jgi:NAD(P)H dehydrogenase (quinone)